MNDHPTRRILPFYIVVDVSFSMTDREADGSTAVQALNTLLPSLLSAIEANPILADKVRISLIDFSDDARVQVPLCDLLAAGINSIPKLEARGGTSFKAAFDLLRERIAIDTSQLRGEVPPFEVYRPAAFFLTDGEPSEPDVDWTTAFAKLTSTASAPFLIPFGIGFANLEVIERLAHPKGVVQAYMAKSGISASDAISAMANSIVESMLESSTTVSDDDSNAFVAPDPDEDLWQSQAASIPPTASHPASDSGGSDGGENWL